MTTSARIPPIQCLLTFDALAWLRSVTLAVDELFVTPSAVSHRVRQLQQIIGAKLFGRADSSVATALVRLKLGAPWLGSGALERISGRNVPSPHAHYLCWRTGTMDRRECAAFADWLKKSVV